MAKTAAKKAVVVLSEQTPKQLQELLATKQADLLGYKRGLVVGELKNPNVIKATRKEIARIMTALSGKEGEK